MKGQREERERSNKETDGEKDKVGERYGERESKIEKCPLRKRRRERERERERDFLSTFEGEVVVLDFVCVCVFVLIFCVSIQFDQIPCQLRQIHSCSAKLVQVRAEILQILASRSFKSVQIPIEFPQIPHSVSSRSSSFFKSLLSRRPFVQIPTGFPQIPTCFS